MMTFAEKMEERGIQKGKLEGEARGIQEGKIEGKKKALNRPNKMLP